MILAIVQARMSSTRMPGKVLTPLLGKPMILRQIERLRQSHRIDQLVVATSDDRSDDVLVETLETAGIAVRRGPLNDVLGRYVQVVREFSPHTVVRLTADCPLADPAIIDHVIDEHLASSSDYTSNTLTPTYPDGLDVECVSADAFYKLANLPLSGQEREHVTLGIYSRPEDFELKSVTQSPDRSSHRWTVDLPEDFRFVESVYQHLYGKSARFDQEAILRLLADQPHLLRTDRDEARNSGLSH